MKALIFCLWLLPGIAGAMDLRTHSITIIDGKQFVYELPGKVQMFYESSPQAVRAMMTIAGVHLGDVVYDLGSGRGVILQAAVYEGGKAVGIEIDPALVTISQQRLKGSAEVITGDFFKTNFSKATVVTMFLGDDVNLMLKPYLLRQLKPGTKIVSNSHGMGDWKPDKTMAIPDCGENEIEKKNCKILMWVVK